VVLRGLGQLAVLLLVLLAHTTSAQAQSADPGTVVQTYLADLNAHNVSGALALFDQYGSATDVHGRVYQGQTALAEFLLSNGFADPSASISTQHLTVAGNRAIWTYACSCAKVPVTVRVVLQHDKISVFAMTPPAVGSTARAAALDAFAVPWLAGVAVLGLLLAFAFGMSHEHAEPSQPRPAQGRLLVGLEKAFALKRRD
jgi:hypothetical protein